MSKTAKKNAKRKEKKKQQKCNEPDIGGSTSADVVPPGGHSLHKTSPGSNNGRLASGETKCDSMKGEADRDATKRMRNLRKKLKQIDDIQRRIDSGENLEKDQLEKVSRRQVVADELEELMLHLNVEDWAVLLCTYVGVPITAQVAMLQTWRLVRGSARVMDDMSHDCLDPSFPGMLGLHQKGLRNTFAQFKKGLHL